MFKKKFWKRRGTRSGSAVLPARRIPKSIARVRTDWVSLYNPFEGCRYFAAAYDPIGADNTGCVSSIALEVMGANQLSDAYGDDVKIVAMRGSLWLRPVFDNIDLCNDQDLLNYEQLISEYFIRVRGGLFKQRNVNPDPAAMTGGIPGSGVVTPHPANTRAWSDAGWLKQFTRTWVPPGSAISALTYNDGQLVGPCSQTTRSAYTDSGWTLASGSGTKTAVNVPAIVTSCSTFSFPSGEGCYNGGLTTHMRAPGWKAVNISSRRTIHMHEDDSLNWFIDWGSIFPPTPLSCHYGDPPGLPCALQLLPELKIKVQYG